jgi:hypothetical protein
MPRRARTRVWIGSNCRRNHLSLSFGQCSLIDFRYAEFRDHLRQKARSIESVFAQREVFYGEDNGVRRHLGCSYGLGSNGSGVARPGYRCSGVCL